MVSGAQIIYQHDVYFDGGDSANGSLYLCAALGAPAAQVEAAIARLRGAGLWSQTPCKQVQAAQKDAYAQQMQFVDSFAFLCAGAGLVAARFDHPKYPSSAARWEAWRTQLQGGV